MTPLHQRLLDWATEIESDPPFNLPTVEAITEDLREAATLIATLQNPTHATIDAMARAAFEDEEKFRTSIGILRTEWDTLPTQFRDNWRSKMRVALQALDKPSK